jgi:predicted molibdopterin-dependent oxidoreductase YjgC
LEELARAQTRITRPLLRSDNGKLVPCPHSEASDAVTTRMKAIKQRYGCSSIIGLASSMACDESLEAFDSILRKTIGTDLIDAFDGDDYRTIIKGSAASLNTSSLYTEGLLEDILIADCLIVSGADPLITHPVAGSYVLRAP